jgi:hypothetical protein
MFYPPVIKHGNEQFISCSGFPYFQGPFVKDVPLPTLDFQKFFFGWIGSSHQTSPTGSEPGTKRPRPGGVLWRKPHWKRVKLKRPEDPGRLAESDTRLPALGVFLVTLNFLVSTCFFHCQRPENKHTCEGEFQVSDIFAV